jgi:RNA polymerase sigma-70 factor (ECF subfamily)
MSALRGLRADVTFGDMPTATDLKNRPDEELALLVKGNDSQSARAYSLLYKRHAPAVLAFLAARLRNHAEASDLNQQVWLKVWERLATHFEPDHFRGWVFQMARNLLIDDRRKRRASSMPEEFDPADNRDNGADDELIQERIDHLKPCVEALGEDRRMIVQARLSGTPFDEIGAKLGIPQNTAMTLFHRAKDLLRDCIERRTT